MLGKLATTVSAAAVLCWGAAINFELMLMTLGSADTSRPMLGEATPVRQAVTLRAKKRRKAD